MRMRVLITVKFLLFTEYLKAKYTVMYAVLSQCRTLHSYGYSRSVASACACIAYTTLPAAELFLSCKASAVR